MDEPPAVSLGGGYFGQDSQKYKPPEGRYAVVEGSQLPHFSKNSVDLCNYPTASPPQMFHLPEFVSPQGASAKGHDAVY